MAEVTLIINAREYKVTCDDGQERHLIDLAKIIEDRVKGLVASVGQVGEARLLMMASLLITDELKSALAGRTGGGIVQQPAPQPANSDDQQLAEVLERCAGRLESVAARLEQD